MIRAILQILKTSSLSNQVGRFLSDKSYAYDAVYFMAKFILEMADDENIFYKSQEKDRYIEYTKDIFQLRDRATGAQNYMLETINLLCFANLLVKDSQNHDKYKILHKEIWDFITDRIENAYILLYLVVYQTFVNDNIMAIYKKFMAAETKETKEKFLQSILEIFREKSVSIGTTNTNWEKQLVKYSLIVLGYANNSDYVTRTLNIKQIAEGEFKKVTIEDISINVPGTRTSENSKKINDYIKTFAKDYVQKELKPYLIKDINVDETEMSSRMHIAEDLASLKIENIVKNTDAAKYNSKYEQDQFIERKVKIRNHNIQHAFKTSLLNNNAHRCPICGFEYEDFLIASHIKPYSKCDDTYDAINNYNGFLMCPNHDKLFESARLMTIDASTGEIILSAKALKSKDFCELNHKKIDKSLIECERRHYLKWHNEEFKRQNAK